MKTFFAIIGLLYVTIFFLRVIFAVSYVAGNNASYDRVSNVNSYGPRL